MWSNSPFSAASHNRLAVIVISHLIRKLPVTSSIHVSVFLKSCPDFLPASARSEYRLDDWLGEVESEQHLIAALPESIGNLTELTELWLPKNELTTLPPSIVNLTNLTKIDLGRNKLLYLPADIGSLANQIASPR